MHFLLNKTLNSEVNMRFKNYRNSYTKDNRIYSKSDIANMTVKDVFGRKQELMAQNRSIGLPSDSELMNSENVIWVESYTRDDGTEVRASLPGIVEAAENQKGYGYVVVINHGRINGKELKTKYAHLSKFDVVKGMQVNSQQKIGLSGGIPGTLGAGSSTGEHLHFEVLEDSLPVDPVKYFKNE